jgi:hypothetical protein
MSSITASKDPEYCKRLEAHARPQCCPRRYEVGKFHLCIHFDRPIIYLSKTFCSMTRERQKSVISVSRVFCISLASLHPRSACPLHTWRRRSLKNSQNLNLKMTQPRSRVRQGTSTHLQYWQLRYAPARNISEIH